MSVKLLDANTINKIAAGEVVERPASVVKELVENAIDAQATRIAVEIQNGGKSYIKVSDNGIGMNREDASLAIRAHATSKLSSASDLQLVTTLGFRGEALPTIAAVSKFSLWTRREGDELGTLVRLTGGHDQLVEAQGCALGTTVLVEDLFFNTPARKKFLKQSASESSKINEYLTKLALSRPSIAFKLINGNKLVLSTPGSGQLIECVESIYGHEITASMMMIEFQDRNDKNFRINGLVSRPNIVKSYRTCQTFIVNGRVIGNRMISKAVEEAYISLVPKGSYPLVVMSIELSPMLLDFNVHPQKAEVRFEDDGEIYRAVRHAVSQALERRQSALTVEPEDELPPPEPPSTEPPSTDKTSSVEPPPIEESPIETPPIEPPSTDPLSIEPPSIEEPLIEEPPPIESEPTVEEAPKVETQEELLFEERTEPKKITPIGQVALCYIVAKGDDGLYLVDQHAAHERIIFDRLSGYTDGIPAQQLLIPQPIDFDENERRVVEDNLELFHRLGFTLERGGDGNYRLIEVPVDVLDSDATGLLREILSSLPTVDNAFGDDDQHRKVLAKNIREACLAMTACRAAIKAGQELNFRQMQMLLDELLKTKFPFTCPHGRPTIISFDENKLATMFKRKGF